jgi:hypothetical protein
VKIQPSVVAVHRGIDRDIKPRPYILAIAGDVYPARILQVCYRSNDFGHGNIAAKLAENRILIPGRLYQDRNNDVL